MKGLNVKNMINLDHWSKSSETSRLKQIIKCVKFVVFNTDSTDSVLTEKCVDLTCVLPEAPFMYIRKRKMYLILHLILGFHNVLYNTCKTCLVPFGCHR